jgi:hypothetical protein
MDDEEQFRVVFGFLGRLQPEVGGRSAEPISPDMEVKIRELAAGTLHDPEREQVLEEVARNRANLDFLARCLQGTARG